jgi:hypothetical protein
MEILFCPSETWTEYEYSGDSPNENGWIRSEISVVAQFHEFRLFFALFS